MRTQLSDNAVDGFDDAHCISEEAIARALGVTRETMARMREAHLIEGEHWRREKKLVVITRAGMAALEAATGEKNMAADIVPGRDAEPVAGLTVTRIPRVNRRVLFAKNGAGEECVVRVRDASRYAIGARIAARQDPGRPKTYNAVGRAPSWKGTSLKK